MVEGLLQSIRLLSVTGIRHSRRSSMTVVVVVAVAVATAITAAVAAAATAAAAPVLFIIHEEKKIVSLGEKMLHNIDI